MPVSTTESALTNIGGINTASQKVLNKISGHKSAEEMIGEYFGLRKEVLFSDDGKDVKGMVNEFIDHRTLQKKGVRFVPYFAEMGMTKEMYDKVIPVEYEYKPKTTNEQHITSAGEFESKSELPNTSKRTRANKG